MKVLLIIILSFLFSLNIAGPIDDLKPGEWYEVPGSRMDAVAEPGSHIGNVSCVMSCWAGGAFDTERNRLYVTGGGHNGYSGNEIYAFDVDSLKWIRLNNSAPIGTGPGGECPADPYGSPCATHTYDGVDYLPPPIDKFILVSFPLNMVVWLFDPDNFTWQTREKYPCDDPGFYWDNNPTGALSAYDPATGLFWWRSSYMGDLAYYNPANDQWRCYGKGKWVGYYHTMAADPKRQKLVAVGQGLVYVWDIGDTSVSTLDLDTIYTNGDNSIIGKNNPGLDYDPISDKMVAWGSGADVYTLD